MLRTKILCVLGSALLPLFTAGAAPVTLAPGDLVVVGKTRCGRVNSRWVPGSVSKSGIFTSLSDQLKSVKKQLKRAKQEKIPALKAKEQALSKKLSRARKACATIVAPTPTPPQSIRLSLTR